jgi:hypothetical protein
LRLDRFTGRPSSPIQPGLARLPRPLGLMFSLAHSFSRERFVQQMHLDAP